METIRRISQHKVPFDCRFVVEKNCSIGLDLTFFALWGVGVKEEREGGRGKMQIKQWLARVTGAAWAGLPARGPGPGSRV